jgi:uncharacterized membrane protein
LALVGVMNDDVSDDLGSPDAQRRPQLLLPVEPSLLRRLRTYFLTGIIVAAPIGITVYVAQLFVSFVDDRVKPLIPEWLNPDTYLPVEVPGLGLVVAIVALTFIGAITANVLGRTIVGIGERMVARMPVVRSIYGALKQIFETVLAQSSKSFREVVLLEYPRQGLWAIAFVTSTTQGEAQRLTQKEVVNIFLPTTPNPTSGFLLLVPRQDLIYLDMTVEEGIKMVISGGLVTPPDRRIDKIKLAETAQPKPERAAEKAV